MKVTASLLARSPVLLLLALSPLILAEEITVSNVEDLYNAVNNPANAGTALILARGLYRLSANDPDGAPRPLGGRLELQPDMSLQGVEGDRSAVVISA
jgi:hypothetical protein